MFSISHFLSHILNLQSTSPTSSLETRESPLVPITNIQIGNHACPGRFFAGVEIKVVMVELLRNWEFRNVGDTEMKGGERPGNIVLGNLIHPNPAAQLEFKRRA